MVMNSSACNRQQHSLSNVAATNTPASLQLTFNNVRKEYPSKAPPVRWVKGKQGQVFCRLDGCETANHNSVNTQGAEEVALAASHAHQAANLQQQLRDRVVSGRVYEGHAARAAMRQRKALASPTERHQRVLWSVGELVEPSLWHLGVAWCLIEATSTIDNMSQTHNAAAHLKILHASNEYQREFGFKPGSLQELCGTETSDIAVQELHEELDSHSSNSSMYTRLVLYGKEKTSPSYCLLQLVPVHNAHSGKQLFLCLVVPAVRGVDQRSPGFFADHQGLLDACVLKAAGTTTDEQAVVAQWSQEFSSQDTNDGPYSTATLAICYAEIQLQLAKLALTLEKQVSSILCHASMAEKLSMLLQKLSITEVDCGFDSDLLSDLQEEATCFAM